MVDIKEYGRLENFCNYDNCTSNKVGAAYQHKKNKRIRCFKYIDFQRGRGDPLECTRDNCKHYIYVNPNQTKITKFIKDPVVKEDISYLDKMDKHEIYNLAEELIHENNELKAEVEKLKIAYAGCVGATVEELFEPEKFEKTVEKTNSEENGS